MKDLYKRLFWDYLRYYKFMNKDKQEMDIAYTAFSMLHWLLIMGIGFLICGVFSFTNRTGLKVLVFVTLVLGYGLTRLMKRTFFYWKKEFSTGKWKPMFATKVNFFIIINIISIFLILFGVYTIIGIKT